MLYCAIAIIYASDLTQKTAVIAAYTKNLSGNSNIGGCELIIDIIAIE